MTLAKRAIFTRRAVQRGVTLIEILVVIAIIAVVSGVAIAGSMQLPNARLRRSATMIASAIKVAYTRATATSRDLRLVMDLDEPRIWLEESDAPMLVQSKDQTGTGGAAAVTEAERAAIAEGERILKGPPVSKPKFHSVATYGFADVEEGKGAKALQRGITFRAVQTAHDESAHTSGRAYLYFWRGGLTERASIQVRIGTSSDDARTLTLLVAPLTGKVSVKVGAAELQLPTDDDHASDRTDTGL
ncbi:MAG TPA: prepilin-type N-terminal cleavage/methylation domain-containing protein [Polyangiaceae bacterium]|jgi:general secretion pathway protein H|nr:prepilin-type N-terminal cleavage/methylation domain-containing protein [Polyangiaceae bacterium]